MRAKSWQRHALALVPVLLCFAIVIAILHPFANVLYGSDDWAYAWSVQRMVLDHKLLASSWVTAAAVPQIFWGTAFCELFGLSFRTMNFATMVFSFAGLVFAYYTAVELGLKQKQAAFLTLFIAFNPNYLSFACSFMSDTYYAVLLLGTVLLYVRGLLRQSRASLLLGSVLASLALMQRQIGVVTPAAMIFSLFAGVLTRRRRLKGAALEGVAAALLPVLTTLVMRAFPDAFGGITHTQEVKMNGAVMLARFKNVSLSIANGYTELVYISVLSLPLLLAFSPAILRSVSSLRSRPQRGVVLAVLILSLGAFVTASFGHGHIFVEGEFLHPVALPPYGQTLWWTLALLGSIIFPVLVALAAIRAVSSLRERSLVPVEGEPNSAPLAASFLALTLFLHWLLVATFISFFNNYFLPLVPLAALLVLHAAGPELARSSGRWTRVLPVLAALLAVGGCLVPADLLVRYVEADERLTSSLIAEGNPDERIFGYPGSYARRHYEIADRETEKNPWGIFARMRNRCGLVLLPDGLKRLPPWPRKLSSQSYGTLVGERAIDVWAKAPQKRHAPKVSTVSPTRAGEAP